MHVSVVVYKAVLVSGAGWRHSGPEKDAKGPKVAKSNVKRVVVNLD